MIKKILLVLLMMFVAHAYIVSIGNCSKYTSNGLECQQCAENFRRVQGYCFPQIVGCKEYMGSICKKCQDKQILINNRCCDQSCIQNLIQKFTQQANKTPIQKMTQSLPQLIDFIGNLNLKNGTGEIVGINLKEYQDTLRWFLIYQQPNPLNYKRLIIDQIKKSAKYVVVDWSALRRIQDYSNVQWRDIDNSAGVLSLFDNFYGNLNTYPEILAKKALLSEINEYELITLSKDKLEIRNLYLWNDQQVILKQLVKSFVSTFNAAVSPAPGTATAPSFKPYELTYEGSDIEAELDVNGPLEVSVELVKKSPFWSHTLKSVVEKALSPNRTQFTIFAQNKSTGSGLKYIVDYNALQNEAHLVSVSEENSPAKSKVTSSVSSAPQRPVPDQTKLPGDKVLQEDGCEKHTSYVPPFTKDIQVMVDRLQRIKEQNEVSKLNLTSSNPFIRGPGLIPRRIVVSQNCPDYNFREVSVVQGESGTTKEYFDYYFEVTDPEKQWYYLGTKNKTQSSTIYANPTSFPIQMVDPSFIVYPNANLFFQKGMLSDFLNSLSDTERSLYNGLTAISTSYKDRLMGKISRFEFKASGSNYYDELSPYRIVGYKMLDPPNGLNFFNVKSVICSQAVMTETVMIGSSGKGKETPKKPAENHPVNPLTAEPSPDAVRIELFKDNASI